MLVAKFGGSSVADADQLRKVRAIVQADPRRACVVVSAPGRGPGFPRKVTDLLLLCREHAVQGERFDEHFDEVRDRFLGIVRDLGLALDLAGELEEVRRRVAAGADAAWTASRGEHFSARIAAALLGFEFRDAAGLVRFRGDGTLDLEATRAAFAGLGGLRTVVPGYYGARPDGAVQVFTRGGSDVSGALAAEGLGAEAYENWTDVSGMMMADPRVVESPRPIRHLTFKELRELSYMGATVLHDEAVFPLVRAGIPLVVRNTDRPEDPGTVIARDVPWDPDYSGITGLAGRKDFTVIVLEKACMNQELGFGRRVLSVLEAHGVSYEHTPTGIDSFSVVALQSQLRGKLDRVLADLRAAVSPDLVEVFPDMALLAVVGRGLRDRPGIAAKVTGALAAEGVNIRMMDQGASGINIILGVDSERYEDAVRAVYRACVEGALLDGRAPPGP